MSEIKRKRKQDLGRYGQQKYSQSRVAWVNANGNEFILYNTALGAEDTQFEGQKGFTLVINLRQMRRPIRVPLGFMTAEEVKALQTFFEYTFEQAVPTAEELDAEARQAWESGDEDGRDYTRLYRASPVLVIRGRDEPEHPPSVSSGSAGVDELDSADAGDGEQGPG